MESLSGDDLLLRLVAVAGPGQGRRVLRRAARLAGVSGSALLTGDDLLRICAALSVEGGLIQQIAEEIARATLGSEPLP